jgi:glycosyltransferase involved in cell wall biosynthesis
MPRVSVLIPVYNGADTVARALESVASQTYRDFETIVVDDGSQDASADVVRRFRWARLIAQPNRGVGATRQRMIEEAAGEFVAFLDCDDAWLPDKLAQQVDVADRTGAVLVNGWCRVRDLQGRDYVREVRLPRDASALDHLLPDNTVVTSSAMIRRDAMLDAGFREALRMAEDWLAWFKVARHGDFALIEDVVSYRFERPESESTPTVAWYRAERRVLEEFVLPAFDDWYGRLPAETRERYRQVARRKLGLIASLEAAQLDATGERSAAFRHHVEALRSAPTRGALLRFARHLVRL